MSILYP